MKRLLITGAAGGLGTFAREHLKGFAETLRISDAVEIGDVGPGEEFVQADLADAGAVMDLVEGCDGIVHFGGISTENTFEKILEANIRGVYNLYEAAYAHGKPRIVFASSNHAIGFHKVSDVLDADVPPIADGLYGASKVWGEQIGLVYYHKYGMETARVRIGSCFEKPRNVRMLATWMSPRDMFALVERIFTVQHLGCPVIYGVSDNSALWWDNSKAGYLGWVPRDSADPWREEMQEKEPPSTPEDMAVRFQGGPFCPDDIHRG